VSARLVPAIVSAKSAPNAAAGAIDTPSLRKAFADASGPENVDADVRRMGGGTPLGRLGVGQPG
jgi:hypothetical protein